jgi:hypothetical protein
MSKKPTEKQAIKAARILKKWCYDYRNCSNCIINKAGCSCTNNLFPGAWDISKLPSKRKQKSNDGFIAGEKLNRGDLVVVDTKTKVVRKVKIK